MRPSHARDFQFLKAFRLSHKLIASTAEIPAKLAVGDAVIGKGSMENRLRGKVGKIVKFDQTRPNVPIFTVAFDGIDNTVDVAKDRIGYQPNLKREKGVKRALDGEIIHKSQEEVEDDHSQIDHKNDDLSSDDGADNEDQDFQQEIEGLTDGLSE